MSPRRRAKRDRQHTPKSSTNSTNAESVHVTNHKSNTTTNNSAISKSDYDLIHAYPPTINNSRKQRRSSSLDTNNLAFSSTSTSSILDGLPQQQKQQQYAGMSSAAACITLELPNSSSNTNYSGRGRPSKQKQSSTTSTLELTTTIGHKKRAAQPISSQTMTKWRKSTNNSVYKFKPVYTHQFFTNEQIMGYKPTNLGVQQAELVAKHLKLGEQHGSFSHHNIAGYTLSIQVRLAPSCRKSCLIVEVVNTNEPLPVQENDNVNNMDYEMIEEDVDAPKKICLEALNEVSKLKLLELKDRPRKATGHACCKIEGCTKAGSGPSKDDLCKRHFTLFKMAGRNSQTGEFCAAASAAMSPRKSSDRKGKQCVEEGKQQSLAYDSPIDVLCPTQVFNLKILPDRDRIKKPKGHQLCKVLGCGHNRRSQKDDMCGSHYNMFKAAGRSTKETGERDGVVPPPPVKKRGRGRPPKAAKPDTLPKEKPEEEPEVKRGRGRPPKSAKKVRRVSIVTTAKGSADSSRFSRKPSQDSLSGVSWDGDDENDGEEYEVPTSSATSKQQGGRKRKRSSPKRASLQKESVLFSLEKDLPADSSVPKEEVNGSGGKRRRGRPVKAKRPSPARQVTDVSDSPSSDEEVVESPRGNGTISPSSSSLVASERMSVNRLVTQIAAGLPGVTSILVKDEYSTDFKILSSSINSIAEVENDYLDEPVGKVIGSYSREKTDMSVTSSGGIQGPSTEGRKRAAKGNFVLTLADMRTDKDGRRYHDEVERVAPWFIEIASRIEVGVTSGIEADGGYWKVLYLFEQHRQGQATKYSLVGYVTLFYQGLQMTVCQAVCLPPYQRAGHGTEMLLAAYDVGDNREILVESPAPAFVALRNRIDYALVSNLIEEENPLIPAEFTQPAHLFGADATPLPENILARVGSALHITSSQVAIAYNIWRLDQLDKSIRETTDRDVVMSMEMSYKTTVKSTLLKTLRKEDEQKKQAAIDLQKKKKRGRKAKNPKPVVEVVQETYFDSMSTEEQADHLEMRFNSALVQYRGALK